MKNVTFICKLKKKQYKSTRGAILTDFEFFMKLDFWKKPILFTYNIVGLEYIIYMDFFQNK